MGSRAGRGVLLMYVASRSIPAGRGAVGSPARGGHTATSHELGVADTVAASGSGAASGSWAATGAAQVPDARIETAIAAARSRRLPSTIVIRAGLARRVMAAAVLAPGFRWGQRPTGDNQPRRPGRARGGPVEAWWQNSPACGWRAEGPFGSVGAPAWVLRPGMHALSRASASAVARQQPGVPTSHRGRRPASGGTGGGRSHLRTRFGHSGRHEPQGDPS